MTAARVKLPGTDLNVSRLCLGCWQFNGNKANANWDAQSEEVISFLPKNNVLAYNFGSIICHLSDLNYQAFVAYQLLFK